MFKVTPGVDDSITTNYGTYQLVNEVTYLGITLDTRTKANNNNYKKVKGKITSIIHRSMFTKPNVQLRITQVYLESVYRYYYTAMVVSGMITIEQALLDWSKILRK